jgi:hypothetical protein
MSSSASPAKLTSNGDSSVALDTRIPDLIAKLEDLQCASETVVQIVQCGAPAVPFLADALIHGKQRSIPQPRCCLVDALRLLGANDVLLEYLETTCAHEDPAIRFAEDMVISAAARAIKLDFSAKAFCILLNLARERSVPGVLEALALYRREESIPCFVRALESDLSRTTAASALEQFGQAAKPYLLEAALRIEPEPPDHESTSSLHRRRACMQLLEQLALEREDVSLIFPALFESDSRLVISAVRLILQHPNHTRVSVAVERLKSLRAHLDWVLEDETEALLAQLDETLHSA